MNPNQPAGFRVELSVCAWHLFGSVVTDKPDPQLVGVKVSTNYMEARMNKTAFVSFFVILLLLTLTHPPSTASAESGWLGVQVKELDESLREALDFKGEGVLVQEVFEDSPASEGGLLAGDIITSFAGEEVDELEDFVDMVRDTEPGSEVKIVVIRKGKKKDLEVKIGESEEPEIFRKFGKKFKGLKLYGPRACLGVRVEDLSEDLGEYFKTSEGALVMSVAEDSPASRAGIKAGDVLMEIGGSKIHDADDVFEVISHKKGGDEVEVKALRKGKEKSFEVSLKECEKHGWLGGGHHGKGRYYLQGPHGGCCMMIPELGDIEIELEDLGDYFSGEDFEKDIEILGELSSERLEELEEGLEELREELKELKESLKK